MTTDALEAGPPEVWQIVLFIVDGKPNHAGLSIPERGLADLSLLGARVVPWDSRSLPKGERVYFRISIPNSAAAIDFLQRPGLLMAPIVKQERSARGWHLTEAAPDYVRQFHTTRSTNPSDMNCVEWILRGLELGGVELPYDVLTPSELLNWCRAVSLEEVIPCEAGTLRSIR